jgi:hypothetical protein
MGSNNGPVFQQVPGAQLGAVLSMQDYRLVKQIHLNQITCFRNKSAPKILMRVGM